MVAEHALAGFLLAAARGVAFQTSELKAGRWTRCENIFLAGKTLGIVGTGSIGSAMARLARAIGMDVVAWTFHPSAQRAQGSSGFATSNSSTTSCAPSDAVSLPPEAHARKRAASSARGSLAS